MMHGMFKEAPVSLQDMVNMLTRDGIKLFNHFYRPQQ